MLFYLTLSGTEDLLTFYGSLRWYGLDSVLQVWKIFKFTLDTIKIIIGATWGD